MALGRCPAKASSMSQSLDQTPSGLSPIISQRRRFIESFKRDAVQYMTDSRHNK